MARVLAVVALLVTLNLVSSDSTFGLQWKLPDFTITGDTTPKDCFASTNSSIPATYAITATAVTGETHNDITEKTCGTTAGRITDLFSDRVWAVKRTGTVATGDCLAMNADVPVDFGANPTQFWFNDESNYFNSPYRLIITRKMSACRYNSDFEAANPSNDNAEWKVAFRRDHWRIHHILWRNTGMTEIFADQLIAGATTPKLWEFPADGTTDAPSFGGDSTGGSCVTRSSSWCPPGDTGCLFSERMESYACPSSAQLLARASVNTTVPTNVWKSFSGIGKDIFGPEMDGNAGLVHDLWSRISVSIDKFGGISVADSADISKSPKPISLNNADPTVVELSNLQDWTGFMSAFQLRISSSTDYPNLTGGTSLSTFFVEFDPTATTFDVLWNVQFDDTFVGRHQWLSLRAGFDFHVDWTCKTLGSTAEFPTTEDIKQFDCPDDRTCTYGRFRYNCDVTWEEITAPGKSRSSGDADYPAVQRQFLNNPDEVPFTPTGDELELADFQGDPVYVGRLVSVTNTQFGMSEPPNGFEGAAKNDEEVKFEDDVVPIEQGDGWHMAGVGMVLLAVFYPLSLIGASVFLGKASGNGVVVTESSKKDDTKDAKSVDSDAGNAPVDVGAKA